MPDQKFPRIMLRHELITLGRLRQRRAERIADKITLFSGSMLFVYGAA